MNRNAAAVAYGNSAKTYSFPRTILTVFQDAFKGMKQLQSVRLNNGLRILGKNCFSETGIRRVVFPSSVIDIETGVFSQCTNLRQADLKAAAWLKKLEDETFVNCKNLKDVLLGDGLEIIGFDCFRQCRLERIVIPRSVQCIERCAFQTCSRLR